MLGHAVRVRGLLRWTLLTLRFSQPDLRIASKLYVDVKAPNKEALNEGLRRVRLAIEDVLSEYGASHGGRSPPTPPLLAPQVEAPVVPLTAPSAPPPAWGAAPPPPPAAAATDEGEQACDLCMADVVANVRLEPCGHYACVACVAGLRRRALFVSTAGVPCPFCRTVVVRYDAPPGVDVGVQVRLVARGAQPLSADLPSAACCCAGDFAGAARDAATAGDPPAAAGSSQQSLARSAVAPKVQDSAVRTMARGA